MSWTDAPRVSLGFFPTPLVPLPRLSGALGGPPLLVKRDDCSGLALGGNKVRKLEFLLGEAVARGCDTVITGGAMQSNHCRQTAAAAASLGLACHLVLGGEAPDVPRGNLLLDTLLGATIHWAGPLRKGEPIPGIAARLEAQGARPFIIPYGGSSEVGALGFVAAASELVSQLAGRPVSQVVVASSSCGTQAGLVVGLAALGVSLPVVGIAIDKGEAGDEPYEEALAALATKVGARVGLDRRFGPTDFVVHHRFTGGGYGVVGELEREALSLAARTEGLVLDPVYTGRALGGLLALAREGRLGPDPVVFWHTGGAPALFAHEAVLA